MRFGFIEAEKASFPVSMLCRVLQVSASGFYAWRQRPESARAVEDRRLAVLVREAHERGRRCYGKHLGHTSRTAARQRFLRFMWLMLFLGLFHLPDGFFSFCLEKILFCRFDIEGF